ncbi:MAG TPA: hypothetical protein VIM55_12525 [Mucilaginibacter sp.]
MDNGKNTAIVSYLWFIGWLIAYFGLHQNNKTRLGSYHLRQTLLLFIASAVVHFALRFTLGNFWIGAGFVSYAGISGLVNLVFFIFWIIGFIGAVNGQERPIPLFGEWAQTMFPNI